MSKYICEMRYEKSSTPTLTKAVEVKGSRALTVEEVDHSVVIYRGDTDVVIDLPEVAEAEVRGFHFVNLGKGKMTINPPEGGTIAGRASMEVPAGRCLVGSHDGDNPVSLTDVP